MSRRLTALVIGNSDYPKGNELTNPVNDAADISAKLTACGFSVTTKLNCTHQEIEEALDDFGLALGDSDVGLFSLRDTACR